MVKVCFLFEGFQGNGGIGRATSILANRLVLEKDTEVHTISYSETSSKRTYTASPKIHEHVLFEKPMSMRKALLLEHAISRVRKIVREEKIDFLIACGALYFPLAILAVRGTGAKSICVEHTSPETEHDYKFQAMCRKIAVQKAHRVVTITEAARQYYINTLGIDAKKVCLIYNPVPAEYYQSTAYNPHSTKIISVGRLSYPKNYLRLVDIAESALEGYPEWHWDIYGEGEEHEEIQNKINSHGLSDRVSLKGQVSNILQRYGEYAFIVMTSRYEGFPMVLLEAAANRLPMVSFDIKTGPNEIIADGINGFLLNEEDTEGMSEKIRQLMENQELRVSMAHNALSTTGKFSIDRIIGQWKSLLNELMQGR